MGIALNSVTAMVFVPPIGTFSPCVWKLPSVGSTMVPSAGKLLR